MSGDDLEPRGLIRQGDVLLVPVDRLPAQVEMESGRLVLAKGEASGHAHVIDDPRARLATQTFAWGDSFRFLVVRGTEAVRLTHEEHDELPVPPGVYEIRRQREYDPRAAPQWVSD